MLDVLIPFLPLLVAGAIAGFMAGLLGIGGGIVTIPALFIAFSEMGVPIEWRMHSAIATSLTIIVATNISSVYAHHQKGSVDWGIVKKWWPAIMVGAVTGSLFAKLLKTSELIYLFAALAVLLGIKMLFPLDKIKLGEKLPTGFFGYFNPGLIGFLSALKGIGGGSYSVPYLTLYSTPIHKAVGTASLAGIVISVSGGLGYLFGGWGMTGLPSGMVGFIHIPSAIVVAISAVLMAPFGAKVAHAVSKTVLSIVFGVFLILATTRLLMAA
ncbi:MAG: sulfite exporter TauE/SafE family protein [Kordiimonadaceae bacterium]|nr:sulfite exporter TauE/SafE family protein [Kordiimonadaceae bacterium]